jgi:hypothetical protein
MGERENGVRIVSSPPIQGRDPNRDRKLILESLLNGAPLPMHRSISASAAEPAVPISSNQCPNPHTGLFQPNALGPFPYLSPFLLGMLATEDDPFVIPLVRTHFGVFNEWKVSPMVVRHHASFWGERVTTLVREGAVFAPVPIQEAVRPTPETGVSTSSFGLGWVGVGSSQVREGHAGPFGSVGKLRDKTWCCFHCT